MGGYALGGGKVFAQQSEGCEEQDVGGYGHGNRKGNTKFRQKDQALPSKVQTT